MQTKKILCLLLLWLINNVGISRDSESWELFNGNTSIHVLLDKRATQLTLRSQADKLYLRQPSGSWTAVGKVANVAVQKAALVINGKAVPQKSVLIRGGVHPSDPFFLGDKLFRGALKLYLQGDTFIAVNVLRLEDYLVGTLASEMSPNWEIEALKAQAVASRSYVLNMRANPRSPYYDVEGTVRDQVYRGANWENQKLREAVRSTEMTALFHNGKPIKAFFHSRCGGITETGKDVWKENKSVFKTRVGCPYCVAHPLKWTAIIPKTELARLLDFPVDKTLEISAPDKAPSGRVSHLTVRADDKVAKFDAETFRSLLGYSRLKSAYFDWKIRGKVIEFHGKGAGHGVGMCQWGARELAQRGLTYRQILKYFYPDSELRDTPALPKETTDVAGSS